MYSTRHDLCALHFFEVFYTRSLLLKSGVRNGCVYFQWLVNRQPSEEGSGSQYCCSALLWLYQIERDHFLEHPVERQLNNKLTRQLLLLWSLFLELIKSLNFLNCPFHARTFQTHVGVDIVTQPTVTRHSIFHSNETQSCHLQQRYWVVTKKDENLDKCYIGRQLLVVSCRCYNLRRNSMRDFRKYFAAFTEDKLMNPNWRSPLRGSFQTADTLQQVITLRRLTILNCVVGPVDWWVSTYLKWDV